MGLLLSTKKNKKGRRIIKKRRTQQNTNSETPPRKSKKNQDSPSESGKSVTSWGVRNEKKQILTFPTRFKQNHHMGKHWKNENSKKKTQGGAKQPRTLKIKTTQQYPGSQKRKPGTRKETGEHSLHKQGSRPKTYLEAQESSAQLNEDPGTKNQGSHEGLLGNQKKLG